MPTTPILGSPRPETLTGSTIALLAPGYRGEVTLLEPAGDGRAEGDPLPLATAAANVDVVVVSQMKVQLQPPPQPAEAGPARGAVTAPPKLILPQRADAEYAVLHTDEDGYSQWIFPTRTDSDVVFDLPPGGSLSTTAEGRGPVTSTMRAIVRVVAWVADPVLSAGALTTARAWESGKRPHALRRVTEEGQFVEVDWRSFSSEPWLLLIHGTFSTPAAGFAGWVGTPAFKATMQKYGGRCIAVAHPTLSASPDDNANWTLTQLPSHVTGPVDIVCHSRGGLIARRLAASDRLTVRRVCQLGAPNEGTPLAHAKQVISFLNGHTALLTRLPDTVSTVVLEGILCVVKLVATGVGHGLPGLLAMEPDGDYLEALRHRTLKAKCWYTVGADYQAGAWLSSRFIKRAGDAVVDGFFGSANDLVVPSAGCHLPGQTVTDSLRLEGGDVHHCNYFSAIPVHERLTAWLNA
jgi:hypothetical protein